MRINRPFRACTICAIVTVSWLPQAARGADPHSSTIGTPVTVGAHGNEPIVKIAPDGTLYISALEYLYYSTNNGATWKASPGTIYNNPAGGGGVNLNTDSSIDIDQLNRLYFTFDYPYAGFTSVCVSDDHAQTFSCNPTTLPGGTDRMWIVAPSTTAAYLVSNEGAEQTLFFKSTDRGANWTAEGTTGAAFNSDTGPLLPSPLSGLIFQPYVNNASNATATTNLNSGPLAFHVFNPATTNPALSGEITTPLTAPNALPSAGFTPNGTLYLVSEEPRNDSHGNLAGYQLTIARSTDQGAHWTVLPPIPGTSSGTQSFSAIATGADGHVGVLYYRTPGGGDPTLDTSATWDAAWAESLNAGAATPSWTVQTIDPGVHTGAICSTAGCTGDNRYSGDFISAQFDAAGLPHLTWVKDLDTSGTNTLVRYAGVLTPGNPTPEFPSTPLLILALAAASGLFIRMMSNRVGTVG